MQLSFAGTPLRLSCKVLKALFLKNTIIFQFFYSIINQAFQEQFLHVKTRKLKEQIKPKKYENNLKHLSKWLISDSNDSTLYHRFDT